MIFGTLVLIFLGVLAVLVVYRWATRFPDRTHYDVIPFLRKLDMEIVYGTLHPDVEDEFRRKLSAKDFRAWQWKRIHLSIHHCLDMAHNCWVFLGWTRWERRVNWAALPVECQTGITELRVASTQARMAAFIIRTRLRLYLLRMALLPFLPPPSFQTLLRKGSPDLVNFYETAQVLAESFSMVYGEEFHQQMLAALSVSGNV